MKCNVDYFIKKFKSIPESRWCSGRYEEGDMKCAIGHCEKNENASMALRKLFDKNLHLGVTAINDNMIFPYNQKTPKQRVLNALKHIKKLKEKQK